MTGQTLWYKDAIFYEVHVKSFKDSNADGIGDFEGLRQTLACLLEGDSEKQVALSPWPEPGHDTSVRDRSLSPFWGPEPRPAHGPCHQASRPKGMERASSPTIGSRSRLGGIPHPGCVGWI